jgi:hypothetical protein
MYLHTHTVYSKNSIFCSTFCVSTVLCTSCMVLAKCPCGKCFWILCYFKVVPTKTLSQGYTLCVCVCVCVCVYIFVFWFWIRNFQPELNEEPRVNSVPQKPAVRPGRPTRGMCILDCGVLWNSNYSCGAGIKTQGLLWKSHTFKWLLLLCMFLATSLYDFRHFSCTLCIACCWLSIP